MSFNSVNNSILQNINFSSKSFLRKKLIIIIDFTEKFFIKIKIVNCRYSVRNFYR